MQSHISEKQASILKVAAFTGGKHVPSARFRVRQLIHCMHRLGIEIVEYFPRLGKYPPSFRPIRPLWAIGSLVERLPAIAASYRYDLTLLQREMLSTFATFEGWTKKPRVFDVDDAIFLHRDGQFARKIVASCALVICGNDFLAEHFSKWNRNVAVVPTGVDISIYRRLSDHSPEKTPLIGWIGTSSNHFYLYQIENALARLFNRYPDTRLMVISDRKPVFSRLAPKNVLFERWSPALEVSLINKLTIAIMPLDESAWSQGKCSFKMIQCMACEIPVVASPIGANQNIFKVAGAALPARTEEEWEESLSYLLQNPKECAVLGVQGRRVVEKQYNIDVIAKQLAELFRQVC